MDMTSYAVDLTDTFGAAYVGVAFSTALYGLTTLQTYHYYTNYQDDHLSTKTLVGALWTLDTAQIALMSQTIYYFLVANYANPTALLKGPPSFYASLYLNMAVSVMVQLFFTYRVYVLASTKPEWGKLKYYLTALVALFVMGHFGTGLLMIIRMTMLGRMDQLTHLTHYMTISAVLHVASEIAIAGSLCGVLYYSRTSFRSTNVLISSLMIYAINRSLLTSSATVVQVIVYAARPATLWFLALEIIVGKLHCVSLLAALNSRKTLRENMDRRSMQPRRRSEYSHSSSHPPMYASRVESTSTHDNAQVMVSITKESHVEFDEEDQLARKWSGSSPLTPEFAKGDV